MYLQEIVRTAQTLVKSKKSEIASQSKEVKKTLQKKEQLMSTNAEIELEIKEFEHQVTKLAAEAKACASKVCTISLILLIDYLCNTKN